MVFEYSKYGCIISIDFGTTFSGSCYAITGGLTDEEIRKNNGLVQVADLNRKFGCEVVESIRFKKKEKTPTIVIYDQSGQLSSWGIDAKAEITKGSVPPLSKVLKEFKLHLPKSVSQKGASQKPGSAEQNPEDSNLRATIDFFKAVYAHIYESLQEHRSNPMYNFDNENIRFIITVPAMWTDTQRSVMRQVAIQAGLINESDHEIRLIIINESLAATLFAERDLGEDILQEGYKYIVCDAGGGTVDIASFIKTRQQKENISYDRCQLTTDSGDLCGSTFIDKDMSALLSLLLYDEVIDKTMDTENLDEDRKNEIKLRNANLEDFIDYFVNDEIREKVTSGKHEFGVDLEDELDDQYYFDLDAESLADNDFDGVYERATIFHDFRLETKLVDDREYVWTKPSEFKLWGAYEDKDVYVNNQGIFWTDYKLVIPFEIMVNHVFKKRIEQTLDLLDLQIKKIGGVVEAIFLVGGLGSNSYLKRRIIQRFGSAVGVVEQTNNGDVAAMKGAAHYGIEAITRKDELDIVEFDFKDNHFNPESYDTVICIDVGYDQTSCSYVNLTFEDGKPVERVVEVTGWPGASKKATQIPTAYQKQDGKWGAQVPETANPEPKSLTVPSKLMSIVKGDLKNFLIGFLSKVHAHILQQLKKNEKKGDASKFRYCITMENSYEFFKRKSDLRSICIEAGIVSKKCDVKRLLLFKREDATAMYFEETQLLPKKFSTYYLQVFFRHDSCHLALHESVRLDGHIDSKVNTNEDTLTDSKYFRNVRGIRSATFEFNFVAKLVANLDKHITKNPCIQCRAFVRHDDYYSSYYSDLRNGFLKFVEDHLDFSSIEQNQKIAISHCCNVLISVYDLLEYVFRPAIQDLVSEFNRYVIQTGMDRFHLDHIFIVDKLFKAQPSTYEFLEKLLIKTLAETMHIEEDLIKSAEPVNAAAITGAVLYGTDPRRYTERVARKTYMVTVTAYNFHPFEQDVLDEVRKLSDEDEIYDIEAKHAYQYGTEPLDLFYQPAYNPSKRFKVGPSYQNLLIRRGTKITEGDQTHGIHRRFFSEKECLVHANIYTSEANDLEFPSPDTEEAGVIDSEIPSHFHRIHQFEIYIKGDPNDPMNMFGSPRHYFDIRMIPDNNEIKFEANIGTRVGEKIPEFRFRDEILTAHIYGDQNEVYLQKTSRSQDEVEETAISQSS